VEDTGGHDETRTSLDNRVAALDAQAVSLCGSGGGWQADPKHQGSEDENQAERACLWMACRSERIAHSGTSCVSGPRASPGLSPSSTPLPGWVKVESFRGAARRRQLRGPAGEVAGSDSRGGREPPQAAAGYGRLVLIHRRPVPARERRLVTFLRTRGLRRSCGLAVSPLRGSVSALAGEVRQLERARTDGNRRVRPTRRIARCLGGCSRRHAVGCAAGLRDAVDICAGCAGRERRHHRSGGGKNRNDLMPPP
jgi:hypothetical protein